MGWLMGWHCCGAKESDLYDILCNFKHIKLDLFDFLYIKFYDYFFICLFSLKEKSEQIKVWNIWFSPRLNTRLVNSSIMKPFYHLVSSLIRNFEFKFLKVTFFFVESVATKKVM